MNPLHLFVEGVAYAALLVIAVDFVASRARTRRARRRELCTVDAWTRHRADLRALCTTEIVRGRSGVPAGARPARARRARTAR